MTPRGVLVFFAELAVYAAAACAGWRAGPGGVPSVVFAVAAVALMATWWGLLHAPRAPLHPPSAVELCLRCVWFLVGVAGALIGLTRPA